MAIKRVGTGNKPPPVPPMFESRKHGGSGRDLAKDEVLGVFRGCPTGYPTAGKPEVRTEESIPDKKD